MKAKDVIIFLGQILFCLLLSGLTCYGATIHGKVLDSNREALTGAYVIVQGQAVQAVAGLDGSYVLDGLGAGTYTITASFIGYAATEKTITLSNAGQHELITFELVALQTELGEVIVTGRSDGGSETYAREQELRSANTLNIVSAKAISLSPDISVAQVVQRVPGLSIERNSNGDPQYAIVRGMDKRYSYTLVNGFKIPSPDNKNRYVPLDIFPANLMERLEVYKSLTADQEGDAIGGAMNMVMKSAPENGEIKGDLQVGYNHINTLYGFNKFNAGVVDKSSPREIYGASYQAQPGDFTKKNLEVTHVNPMPDLLASLSAGDRFFQNRLGILLGVSLQNSYRSTKSIWYDYDTDRYSSNLPSVRSVQDRYYSTQQIRAALHSRIDFKIADQQTVKFYGGYYKLANNEARQIKETFVDGRKYDPTQGNAILSYSTRTRITDQSILTASLEGSHRLVEPLTFTWAGVVSQANNDQPDNARFVRNGELINFQEQPQNVERRNSRQWSNNSDRDITAYANFILQPEAWHDSYLKAGALHRTKKRDSYYNRYIFDPNPGRQIQGQQWNTYSDVTWEIINPAGSATDAMNYLAGEDVTAAYALGTIRKHSFELTTGVRMEQTNQHYTLKFPLEGQTPDSSQHYTDLLPSLSFKYRLSTHTNIRFTYYKAVARPNYFDIVPYRLEDDGYPDYGNPKLKRTRAHNVDVRWENFNSSIGSFLIGAFYKYLQDPIEYGAVRLGVNNEMALQPNNFGSAQNMGIELDFTRYFRKIGIKANYTFTHSRITTTKVLRTRVNPEDQNSELYAQSVNQSRVLQGQAKNIGNIALLYKDQAKGFEAQLSIVYTGERLDAISPFLNNDTYAQPITIVDFSSEKRISRHFDIFLKATNLLNAAYKVYIKQPVLQPEGNTIAYPYQDEANRTLIRSDQYYQSFRIGIRHQWNRSE
jgi:hypothetical protein